MSLERYRNNPIIEEIAVQLVPPLIFDGEIKIAKGGRLLSQISLIEDRLYASSKNYLACYEPDSKKVLWQCENQQFCMGSNFNDALHAGKRRK